jgi:CRISPR-associated protein Csx17
MDLVDHAAAWIDRLSRAVRGDGAPASWATAARACEEAVLTCCRNGEPRTRLDLLLALGAAEAALARVPAKTRDAGLQPLLRLPSVWLLALPPSPALRLAAAIASQSDGDLRRHWLTRDGFDRAKRADVDVVATTGDYVADAVAILRRRCRVAGPFPLSAHPRHGATLADLADLIAGTVDTDLMWALVRPLLALDWSGAEPLAAPATTRDDLGRLTAPGILRLAHAPETLPGANRALAVDPGILARLLSGDAPTAIAHAARRLAQVGLRPYAATAVADPALARRWAASLIVPLASTALGQLAQRLTKPVADTAVRS